MWVLVWCLWPPSLDKYEKHRTMNWCNRISCMRKDHFFLEWKKENLDFFNSFDFWFCSLLESDGSLSCGSTGERFVFDEDGGLVDDISDSNGGGDVEWELEFEKELELEVEVRFTFEFGFELEFDPNCCSCCCCWKAFGGLWITEAVDSPSSSIVLVLICLIPFGTGWYCCCGCVGKFDSWPCEPVLIGLGLPFSLGMEPLW